VGFTNNVYGCTNTRQVQNGGSCNNSELGGLINNLGTLYNKWKIKIKIGGYYLTGRSANELRESYDASRIRDLKGFTDDIINLITYSLFIMYDDTIDFLKVVEYVEERIDKYKPGQFSRDDNKYFPKDDPMSYENLIYGINCYLDTRDPAEIIKTSSPNIQPKTKELKLPIPIPLNESGKVTRQTIQEYITHLEELAVEKSRETSTLGWMGPLSGSMVFYKYPLEEKLMDLLKHNPGKMEFDLNDIYDGLETEDLKLRAVGGMMS